MLTWTRDGIRDDRPSPHGPRVDGSKIQVFATKRQAERFARDHGIRLANVCPAQTRFQLEWTIFGDLGLGYLARQSPLLDPRRPAGRAAGQ